MLGHNGVVVVARNDLQLSFQVLGLGYQAGLGIAFRVGLRRVHIALAVHHLVPLPVNDGTAGHADLEHVRIGGHERYGHEASERPAVDAQPVGIDVRQRLQECHALHLVFHLYLSQLAEGGLLEVAAAALGASVVENEEQVSFLCHIGFPRTAVPVPGGFNVMRMGAAIDIDHGRILPRRVKVVGLHHAVVEVCHAVGSFYGATLEDGLFVVSPWIFGCQQPLCLAGTDTDQVDVAGYVGL